MVSSHACFYLPRVLSTNGSQQDLRPTGFLLYCWDMDWNVLAVGASRAPLQPERNKWAQVIPVGSANSIRYHWNIWFWKVARCARRCGISIYATCGNEEDLLPAPVMRWKNLHHYRSGGTFLSFSVNYNPIWETRGANHTRMGKRWTKWQSLRCVECHNLEMLPARRTFHTAFNTVLL